MSDSATVFRRINKTPLRDLLRGRITGRLDWKFRLAAAGLSTEASQLIARVVKRTRLFRLEKASVADELMAHFFDGLRAGSSTAELVEKFGDERVAARLIRLAKRRGRALPWRIWSAGIRAFGVLLVIYAILLVRMCISHPAPNVNYLATVNETITRTPADDRAWPLWRSAILAVSDFNAGQRSFQGPIATEDGLPWPQTVKWLNDRQPAVEMARQAAQKPALGFVLGPNGSEDDTAMFPGTRQSDINQSDTHKGFAYVLLPYLNDLRTMAKLLTLDARRAAEQGDGPVAEADLVAALNVARQLREADGFLLTQLSALSVGDMAMDRLGRTLCDHPEVFKDDALIRLAHAISGPEVTADLMSLRGERELFADIVQRLYSDNGRGDGHMTLSGLRSISHLLAPMNTAYGSSQIDVAFAASSAVPVFAFSRAQLMSEYDQLMNEEEADFHLPIRQVDAHRIERRINEWQTSPVNRVRYAVLLKILPASYRPQASCERYLGERDGTLVGIALELYHRRHGKYPAALSELTPQQLPAIPADRITGEPVKYRLIDGKPVVYSVGADRVDDGGRPPAEIRNTGKYRAPVASWGEEPASVPSGDWILFGPKPAEGDETGP